ncbi:glycoside hydrolase family 2 protein [Agromyces protaetiae]|uniref:beta-mannosidase n=1 Tax=Agromyces protaetiae TaxID=2509455 RepID=A0A4P6FGU5_9MICO|nr:glycoside hydrolase family 2 protein [Agromyces protaetiae]QAY73709.1 glycoside hydrolase family 2 protein [Agromyces protaetiae]
MTFLPLTSASGIRWTVEAVAASAPVPAEASALLEGRAIAATVPGLVHTDLLDGGLIPDPFDGDNERRLAWIGRTDWRYRASFDWHDDGNIRHDLVARGLDTAATVRLNGAVVAETANQHRSYRFDVRDALVEGRNELVIDFRAPRTWAEEQAAIFGARPSPYPSPYNAVRKVACDYGWDWGIDLASSGIWREIGLDSWSGVRIASVRPLVDVTRDAEGRALGSLAAHVALEWADDTAAPIEVTATIAGRSARLRAVPGHTEVLLEVDAGEVDLWHPRGYGDATLYDARVTAGDTAWESRVGFRTVCIEQTPDAHGTSFVIVVNDEPVNVRGANWIPRDALVTRLTDADYRQGVADAIDANMNLLRVWGGGHYEDDPFYAACDEQGVLVWQDFTLACAAYAEDDPLWSEFEAEAREHITRLSVHPSLVVWNGGNENLEGYVDWGWRQELAGRTWGEGYAFDLFPALVAELDPTRPYFPGSPYSMRYAHPNDPKHGTKHIWDVWNQLDYTAYANHEPRFVAEFGFQGPPAWSTLTGVVHDEPLDPYGPHMLVHQKAADGNLKLERGLGAHLPQPRTIDEWHFATQLNQANAVAFGIAHFRSLFPRNTGQVVWQLDDSWPVISWAAVDFHGIRKPLWHALRRVYEPRLLTLPPRDGALALVALNDTAESWTGTIELTRETVDGDVLASERLDLSVDPRGASTLALSEAVRIPDDSSRELLVVRTVHDDGAAAVVHPFAEDAALSLKPLAEAASIEVVADEASGRIELTVTVRSLVKDLVVQADRLDANARVDTALVTLRAGERHTFIVTGVGAEASSRARDVLTSFPGLSSVNDLVAR